MRNKSPYASVTSYFTLLILGFGLPFVLGQDPDAPDAQECLNGTYADSSSQSTLNLQSPSKSVPEAPTDSNDRFS